MPTREIDIIKKRTDELSKEEKRQLIEFLTNSIKNAGRDSTQLQFGKYRTSGTRMSTAEDFQIAEWHGSDFDLNGN